MKPRLYDIRLSDILLSAIVFSPLLVNIYIIYPDFSEYNGRNQLALFYIFSTVTFVCLVFLSPSWRKYLVVLLSFFGIIAAINTAYILLAGNPIPSAVFASIWESNSREVFEFTRSPFFRKFMPLVLGIIALMVLVRRLKCTWSIQSGSTATGHFRLC